MILLPLCTVFRIHNYAKIHHLHNTCKRSVVTPLALSQFIFKTSGQSNIAADMNTFDLTEIMQTNNPLYDKYEGESNENLKFVIKNQNFAPLSCKFVSMQQTACRMAYRWQHSADALTPSQYQHKDGCPT